MGCMHVPALLLLPPPSSSPGPRPNRPAAAGAHLPVCPPAIPVLPVPQVDLYCECPLWPDDGMCSLRDCSVCECEEAEVPEPWRKAEAVEACDSESSHPALPAANACRRRQLRLGACKAELLPCRCCCRRRRRCCLWVLLGLSCCKFLDVGSPMAGI